MPMTMTSISKNQQQQQQQVVTSFDLLNQRAIRLMQESHYHEASQLFRRGLQELRSTLATTAHDEVQQQRQQETSSPYFIEQVEVMDVQECEKHQKDDFSLYSKALLFHSAASHKSCTTPNEHKSCTTENEEIILAILFFNLGLALHLEATASTDSPLPKKVQCVLRMYDMALQVVQQACQKCNSSSDNNSVSQNQDVLLILTLAIMNNKGHMCATFFELKALTRCIQSMECLLTQFENDQEHCWTAKSESDLELCSQIKLNVMMFSKGTIRSAPAA